MRMCAKTKVLFTSWASSPVYRVFEYAVGDVCRVSEYYTCLGWQCMSMCAKDIKAVDETTGVLFTLWVPRLVYRMCGYEMYIGCQNLTHM